MIYITYKVNNLDNSKLISEVFARTRRSTIGDKVVETLFSNVVTSEIKTIYAPPLSPPFKGGVSWYLPCQIIITGCCFTVFWLFDWPF